MRYFILVGLSALMFGIGYVAGLAVPNISNAKSEYVTVGIIRDVETYVRDHDGAWPKSWADLNIQDSGLTRIDFSIDSRTCDGFTFANSINTKSGRWYTNPNYKETMASLWETIKSYRKK